LSEKRVIEPVLDLLIETMPRDNLISSACLELFEHIKKESIKELVKHMVENYREKLHSLSYMELFRTLLLRYDQTTGFTANMDYFLESEEDASRDRRRNRGPPQRHPMEHLTMDQVEDEYFNASDDEEDLQAKAGDRTLSANGESPGAKLLVDYASDEELDDNIEAGAISGDEDKSEERAQKAGENSSAAVPPPERVSEKRRREEDEEDDLSKMVQHKRRNSTSAGSNASSTTSSALRKKKMVAGARDSGGGPKKISISLSSNAKTGDLGGDD
jgi:protein phosphatase-4 regulatory subunit 3